MAAPIAAPFQPPTSAPTPAPTPAPAPAPTAVRFPAVAHPAATTRASERASERWVFIGGVLLSAFPTIRRRRTCALAAGGQACAATPSGEPPRGITMRGR